MYLTKSTSLKQDRNDESRYNGRTETKNKHKHTQASTHGRSHKHAREHTHTHQKQKLPPKNGLLQSTTGEVYNREISNVPLISAKYIPTKFTHKDEYKITYHN